MNENEVPIGGLYIKIAPFVLKYAGLFVYFNKLYAN